MKTTRVAAAVVAVLLPLSAACGGSKDIATNDPMTSSTPPTPTTQTTPSTPTTPTPTPIPTPTSTPTPTQDGNRVSGTGFSIELPSDWEDITATLTANNPQLDIAIGKKNATTFRTNFNVIKANPTSATIEHDSAALRLKAASELKSVTHKTVSPLPDATIDGEAAIGQTSSFVSSGTSITFQQYVVIHDGLAYPLTLTFATSNADQARPSLTGILGSWQWTG